MKKPYLYSLILVFVLFIVLVIANNIDGYGRITRYVLGVATEQSSSRIKSDVVLSIVLVSDIESDFNTLDRFITYIKERGYDSIFLLGDITTLGTSEDMSRVKDIVSGDGLKVYSVPGDRDLWKSNINNFNQYFGSDYYIEEIGDVTFLFVNNADEYNGISTTQYNFIEENINKADFIVLHNPIYFEGSIISSFFHKGMGQYSLEVESQRKKLLELVRTSNVKAVFAGDMHMFTEQTDSKDTDLMHYTVGSLNKSRSIDAPSYAILEILSDGEFRISKQYLTL